MAKINEDSGYKRSDAQKLEKIQQEKQYWFVRSQTLEDELDKCRADRGM